MPILLAPLSGFALGALLAWYTRNVRDRDDGPLVTTRCFLLVSLFAGFVYAPIVGYFAAFHPDWAYLYLAPARAIPSAVDLALVLVAASSVTAGFAAATRAARAGRLTTVATLGGAPTTLVLALSVILERRLATSATYAQYHGDFGTESITSGPLGRAVLFMGLVLALGVAWTSWNARRA